jgi:uncharacterized phage infection (PIP) family protein YhgE
VGIAGPNKIKPHRRLTAMSDGNISRGDSNRPVMQLIDDGGNQYIYIFITNCPRAKDLDNDIPTFSSSSSSKKDDALSELASSLQETNAQNENIIEQLLSRLTKLEDQLQSQSKSMQAEINERKEKHLLVEKALNQVSSHYVAIKDPPAQSDELIDIRDQLRRQNYELLEKIGRLTYDNGQLLANCRRHEEERSQHEDLHVFAEELEKEKKERDEQMSLITDKLVDFTQVHKDCIQRYEAQLAGLKVEKNQAVLSKEELNAMWLDELKEQKKEVGNLKKPNKEGYKTCEVLHQKLDMLYEELDESRAGDEIGSEKNETRNEREIKLAKLKLKRVSWANDNDKYLRS